MTLMGETRGTDADVKHDIKVQVYLEKGPIIQVFTTPFQMSVPPLFPVGRDSFQTILCAFPSPSPPLPFSCYQRSLPI